MIDSKTMEQELPTYYRKQTGDRTGHNWRIPAPITNRPVRQVLFDTNYWKSFVHARLAVPVGEKGLSLALRRAGRDASSVRGSFVYGVPGEDGRSGTDWFDGIVGCAVAVSMQGAMLSELAPKPKPKKKRLSIEEMYGKAREREQERIKAGKCPFLYPPL